MSQNKARCLKDRPWTKIREWAALRRDMEEKFPAFAEKHGLDPELPWMSRPATGNTRKVLYMHLMQCLAAGTVGIVYGQDVFFNIAHVMVPADKIDEFNQGRFPSIRSVKKNRNPQQKVNTIIRQWGIAGFEEVLHNGNLWFSFKPEVREKHRAQARKGKK